MNNYKRRLSLRESAFNIFDLLSASEKPLSMSELAELLGYSHSNYVREILRTIRYIQNEPKIIYELNPLYKKGKSSHAIRLRIDKSASL